MSGDHIERNKRFMYSFGVRGDFMVIPWSEFKTLRNADIRRTDSTTLGEYYFGFRPKKDYEQMFYSYNPYGKSYDENVEFFTGPTARIGKFAGSQQIYLCLSRAYCKGELVGLDLASMYFSKSNNGGVKIFVHLGTNIPLESIATLCLNDSLYEVINGRVINLSFNKDGKVEYTKEYLDGNFKPIDIQVSRPYDRFEYHSWHGVTWHDTETLLSYPDVFKMLKWIHQINNMDLAPFLKRAIPDFYFGDNNVLLRWKVNVE